ncbi:DNA primase [Pseudoalteromonas phage J2-1_QLiu-2017]|nr:DNA primase [Pseudoalteromonas phage J2-1_QLiu-2017]
MRGIDRGWFIGNFPCVANECPDTHKECHSSDALSIYEHDLEDGSVTYSGYCWSCNQSFSPYQLSKTILGEELGIVAGDKEGTTKLVQRKAFERKPSTPPLTEEEVTKLINEIGYLEPTDPPYRGIRPETFQFFGHLVEKDKFGNPKAIYMPETQVGINPYPVTGYKIRFLPKFFSKIGQTGSVSDLAGMAKFRKHNQHRDILIVGGEIDLLSAYQMLRDNQISRGQQDYADIPVVSPTTGETSAWKQIQKHFDFFDQFENIYIGMDNDEAGDKATAKIIEVLPKEKVKVVKWTGKDPNAMLQKGMQRQFISDFYNAKPVITNGIMGSNELMDFVAEELLRPRILLPEYMSVLQEKTKGGFLQGRIINIIGDTSVGKSTHVNGMVYDWLFNAPEKCGIVSLEATAGQYALDLLSLHLGDNLAWKGSGAEILEYLEDPDIKARYDDLFTNEFGEARFAILDEREGDIKLLERQMEILEKKHGCKVIVVDVLTDILRGCTNEQQADHLMFQKAMVKRGITIINVLHTRKPPPNRDGIPQKATEYDALGSSTFVQSAAINIVINRNKMADCPIEKNSTYVDLPKVRGGETGPAGVWYFDPETRRVYDRDKYFADNPTKLPAGFNLQLSSYDRSYYTEEMEHQASGALALGQQTIPKNLPKQNKVQQRRAQQQEENIPDIMDGVF